MATPIHYPSLIRFGAFEMDVAKGELRKRGIALKLHPQPFRVLLLLVENSGQIVTREQIRACLWNGNTYVDFERGINFCINQIRKALADDAERPEFIETLPKQGYRFIAAVSGTLGVGAKVHELMPVAPVLYKTREPTLNNANWKLVFPVALALLLIIALVVWLKPLTRPELVESRGITADARPKGTYAALATDGVRVYFQESKASRSFIAEVSAIGGETVEIQANPAGTLYDISPDATQLLYGVVAPGGIQLWIRELPGGATHRVGDLMASDGGWAPDGQHIVYVNRNSVYLARADGTGSQKVAGMQGLTAWPRISPDGSRIRFTATDSAQAQQSLWEVMSDGSGLHEILPAWNKPAKECCGNWTSDGKHFVFQSERDGITNIWALPERRGWFRGSSIQPIQLTNGPLDYFLPLPSRDGNRIFAIGQQIRSELVRYDLKSTAFVPYLSGISATGVDISRDGRWAAYIAYPEGTLWRARVDGSDRLQLTFQPMTAWRPRWSPDGRRIAVTAWEPEKPTAIYVIPPDGGSLKRILPEGSGWPTWSPDGNYIAFNAVTPGTDSSHRDTFQIKILDLVSGHISSVPDSNGMRGPQWSLDGRYLVAKSSDDHRCMQFDRNTQRWSILAQGDVLSNVRWSRDGNYVYYEAVSGSESALMRIRFADHHVERVMDFRNIRRPLVELSSSWSGLAEDGSPLLQRDVGTQEIYALKWKLR
jgi:Tol biopolymer transport system component/DNA-binding winged helix-turn-helix (wHTH) protein